MNRTNLMTLAAVMLVASACAQFAAGADLCTGAVDPYDVVSEKGRFYAVAGRDNELTAEEFNATKSAPGTFRRSFDRWSEMLKFDRDGNKSLDWLEADTYRYAMRKMVLASYDTNTDGKLGGPERQMACKALASGRIRFPVNRSTPPPPPPKYRPESHKKTSHKEASRKPPSSKPDKQHDARSSEAAKAAHKEAQLREAQKKREEFEAKRKEYEAKRDLAKFDKNKDGGLDGNEAAERDKYNSEKQARMAESKKRHDDMMRKYDKNGNGRIDDNEKAAVKEAMRQESAKRAAEAKEASKKKMEEYRARREVQKFDKNKDGRLDEAESTALNEYRAKRKILMDEYLKKYDTNGDGQVSVEEKARYRQQLEKQKRETVKHKKDPKKDPAKPKPPKSKSKKKQSRKDR